MVLSALSVAITMNCLRHHTWCCVKPANTLSLTLVFKQSVCGRARRLITDDSVMCLSGRAEQVM